MAKLFEVNALNDLRQECLARADLVAPLLSTTRKFGLTILSIRCAGSFWQVNRTTSECISKTNLNSSDVESWLRPFEFGPPTLDEYEFTNNLFKAHLCKLELGAIDGRET
jgi:hypothetical protein